jgi:hypothetical protein
MNLKQATKTLKAMKRRASDEEAEALAVAIEQLVKEDRNREAEIEKAVELIRDAVFYSDGNLNESTWSYIKDRIDFPPDGKAEIIRRLGLTEKE